MRLGGGVGGPRSRSYRLLLVARVILVSVGVAALTVVDGATAGWGAVGGRSAPWVRSLRDPGLVRIALPRRAAVLRATRTPLLVRLSSAARLATLRVTVNRHDVTGVLRRREMTERAVLDAADGLSGGQNLIMASVSAKTGPRQRAAAMIDVRRWRREFPRPARVASAESIPPTRRS